MYQGIVFGTTLSLIIIALLIFRKLNIERFNVFLKITTIVFLLVGFFRFFLSDSFIDSVNSGIIFDNVDLSQTILRWGYYLNYAILPMSVFFKNRLFRNIASYFCLPFSIACAIYFNDFMPFFLDPAGRGIHFDPAFRYAYFCIELILAIFIPIITQIKYKHVFNVKSGIEWRNFFICLPLILLQMIPVYIPQHIFGYTGVSPDAYSGYHFIWIAITLIEIFVLYKLFNFKTFNERYMLCVFLTIVLFFHYDSLYLMGITLPRLPVQLCNMAAYFYIICIPLRLKKMFNFCFICNIVGTIIATVTPDFSSGALGFWNMHYMYEHMLVLIIPALCMGLRIFPRINKHSLKHMVIGFSCYFVFCLTLGTILNGYSDVTGVRVNYFFLFNTDTVFKRLPFLKFTESLTIYLGRFTINPIYVSIIYGGFLFLCVLFYWLVIKLYDYVDDHYELRKSKIELYEKITGKKYKGPVEYID